MTSSWNLTQFIDHINCKSFNTPQYQIIWHNTLYDVQCTCLCNCQVWYFCGKYIFWLNSSFIKILRIAKLSLPKCKDPHIRTNRIREGNTSQPWENPPLWQLMIGVANWYHTDSDIGGITKLALYSLASYAGQWILLLDGQKYVPLMPRPGGRVLCPAHTSRPGGDLGGVPSLAIATKTSYGRVLIFIL